MSLSWQRFAIASVAAVIALLIASNVLLLSLVLGDDHDAVSAKQTPQAALPALPAPSQSGTSKALLKELDKTKKQFKEPVSQALADLQSVSSSTTTLDQLPYLLQEMIASTATLEDVAPELRALAKRMKSLNAQITRMSKFTVGLGPVITDLELTMHTMRDDIARIRVCTEKPDTCK